MSGLPTGWRQISWIGYGAGLCAVAAIGIFIGLMQGSPRVGNMSMLYLIAVLGIAIGFGRGPAVLVSITAFLTFNWFFVEPLHSFTVAEPEEWVALLLFLLTALITGQLAAGQRRRAQEAERREREAVVLYDVVRLMADPDVDRALRAVAERLRQELRLVAVAIDVKVAEIGFSSSAEAGDLQALRIARSSTPATSRLLGEGRLPPTAGGVHPADGFGS